MKREYQDHFTKRLETFCFKQHKSFDVSKIKQIINNFDEEWYLDTSRQQTLDPLKGTRTYFLKNYEPFWETTHPYITAINDGDSEIWKLVRPIVNYLEDIHDGKVGRIMISKLLAGEDVDVHMDPGQYAGVVRRNHVPIETNDGVIFSVAGESVNMKEGECWEINNNKPHGIKNKYKLDRVHLIIDVIPNKYIK
jgi:hypothetical protein